MTCISLIYRKRSPSAFRTQKFNCETLNGLVQNTVQYSSFGLTPVIGYNYRRQITCELVKNSKNTVSFVNKALPARARHDLMTSADNELCSIGQAYK